MSESWDDDGDGREWDDPPGVDLEDSAGDATDGEASALDVATEGESPVRGEEREPLTPGDISAENALFVALGVGITLWVLVELFL